jgi:hypothetical protein
MGNGKVPEPKITPQCAQPHWQAAVLQTRRSIASAITPFKTSLNARGWCQIPLLQASSL